MWSGRATTWPGDPRHYVRAPGRKSPRPIRNSAKSQSSMPGPARWDIRCIACRKSASLVRACGLPAASAARAQHHRNGRQPDRPRHRQRRPYLEAICAFELVGPAANTAARWHNSTIGRDASAKRLPNAALNSANWPPARRASNRRRKLGRSAVEATLPPETAAYETSPSAEGDLTGRDTAPPPAEIETVRVDVDAAAVEIPGQAGRRHATAKDFIAGNRKNPEDAGA